MAQSPLLVLLGVVGMNVKPGSPGRSEEADSPFSPLDPTVQTRVGRWDLDVDSSRLQWSDETLGIFELDRSDFAGTLQAFMERVHEDDRALVLRSYEDSLRCDSPFSVEHRIVMPSGAIKWVHEVCFHEKDDQGRIISSHGHVFDITRQRILGQELLRSEQRFGEAMSAVPFGVLIVHGDDRRIVYSNEIFARMIGRSKGEVERLRVEDLHGPQMLDMVVQRFAEHQESQSLTTRTLPYRRADGTIVLADVTSRSYVSAGEIFVIGIISPVESVLARADVVDEILARSGDGIIITSVENRILWVNDVWCRATGYGRDEVIGENPRFLQSGLQDAEFYAAMWSSLVEHGTWEGEVWNRRKDGELFCESLRIFRTGDAEAGTLLYIGIISDVSEVRSLQRRISLSDSFDQLTGLASRSNLERRLADHLARIGNGGPGLEVVWIDLVGFGAINQSRGFGVGDQVLVALANALGPLLLPSEFAGRVAGDQFVVILPQAEGGRAVELAQQLNRACRTLSLNGSDSIAVKPAVGVSRAPVDGLDADLLMRCAATAAELAKVSGAVVELFRESMLTSLRRGQDLLAGVARAMANDELFLVYQPKVSLRTRLIEDVEALVRWRTADGRILPPGEWLPWVQRGELMIELERWIIQRALRDVASMRSAGVRTRVAVNISAGCITRPQFAVTVRSLIRAAGLMPTDIQFEITENELMAERATASDRIATMRQEGIRFSIDDFGTGYSSLAHLRELPVSELKLDRSLVHGIHRDPRSSSVVRAAIGIGASFGLHVVCEGIEDRADAAYLAKLGADAVQGFYFSKPLELGALIDLVRLGESRIDLPVLSPEPIDLLHLGLDEAGGAFLRSIADPAGVICRSARTWEDLMMELACASHTSAVLLCTDMGDGAELDNVQTVRDLYPQLQVALGIQGQSPIDLTRLAGITAINRFLTLPLSMSQVEQFVRSLAREKTAVLRS